LNKAASLATLVALALLGVVLAYWSWEWLAPPPAPRAPAAVELAAGTSTAGRLFRTVKEGAGAPASGAVRLMGVVAGSGSRPGHAVLRLDSKKTVAVLQGQDIEPGLRLAEVHVDHVVLERNGARETLAWPEKNTK
jgi:general secretion pathway protein C